MKALSKNYQLANKLGLMPALFAALVVVLSVIFLAVKISAGHDIGQIGLLAAFALVTAYLGFLALRMFSHRLQAQKKFTEDLNRLTSASAEIFAIRDLDHLLPRVAELARSLVPSHQSVISLTTDPRYAQSIHHVSLSDKYAHWRAYDGKPDGSGIYRMVCERNEPMRLTQEELVNHPAWKGFGAARADHPPMRGWLAAPLIAEGGENLGLVQLSDRCDGDFTEEDLALLVQLAQIASAAVENIKHRDERAEAVKAAEQARLETVGIFQSMSDAFSALDRDGRYVFVNARCEELLGRSKEELLGRRLTDVFPHVVGTAFHDAIQTSMQRRIDAEVRFFSDRGKRWYEVRVHPRGEGVAIYSRDVTERVETEAALRQAQKMEMVGQLTGGLAHDFNNLLTIMLGNLDVLRDALKDDRALFELVTTAETAGNRAAELISRLTAFARRQALEPKAVNVNHLISELDGLLRRAIGEHVEIELVRGAGLWQAMIDPNQLENAILNLAINARDAMSEGGKLTIETANAHIDSAYAQDHEEVRAGQYVLVAVSDTGCGMTADVMARAFEPFFTTKEVGKGSGLGLSMVFGFIKQSGGHVKIYSEIGHGTIVKMYLPRSQQAVVEKSRVNSPAAVEGGTEAILLVEDEKMVRDYTERTLRSLGYRVAAVADAGAAIRLLSERDDFDLLLTDVILPGGTNGRELAEVARRLRPRLNILYMSGYTENAIVHHGRLDPGVRLLNKPFRKADLAREVRAAMADSAPAGTPL